MGVIVDGGMCRRPGPNFRGIEGFVEVGRSSEEISSPGKTTFVAMKYLLISSCYQSIMGFVLVRT